MSKRRYHTSMNLTLEPDMNLRLAQYDRQNDAITVDNSTKKKK